MSLIDRLSRKSPKPTDPGRRSFLKKLGAGLVGIGLEEMVRPFTALAKPKKRSSYEFSMPSDAELLRYMSQTVEETLAEAPVTYVDDSNYGREVFGADRPVMVLFYNNRSEGSAGNAALSKVLSDKYPDIKFCAYKVSDDSRPTRAAFENVKKYGLKTTPAIMFYSQYNGMIINAGEDLNLHGGWKDLKKVKEDINYYIKNIPKLLL